MATKLFLDFCPDFFVASWGLPGSFFGASCKLPYSWYYLLSPKEAPKKLKKIQGRNPEIISLLFWDKLIFHKDMIKLSDLKGQKIDDP